MSSNKPSVVIKQFDKEKPMSQLIYHIREELNRLADLRLGKILTIIDATIADGEQRKAIKDLIKQSYWHTGNDYYADVMRMLLEFDQEHVEVKLSKDEANMYLEDRLPSLKIDDYRSWFGQK